ncbi:MAG TPA: type II toxin-antitoxin system ParD family antitoxin [Caulobacter sp.]|nr:type II toxin-antitoxin system ParD family antitoxin [Caulobacter sp.]
MTLEVKLPPGLEAFVESCVADGRYADVSEVVNSGLRLLQGQETRKQSFMAMLNEVEAEVARGEVFTLDEVMADIDALIEAAETHAAE